MENADNSDQVRHYQGYVRRVLRRASNALMVEFCTESAEEPKKKKQRAQPSEQADDVVVEDSDADDLEEETDLEELDPADDETDEEDRDFVCHDEDDNDETEGLDVQTLLANLDNLPTDRAEAQAAIRAMQTKQAHESSEDDDDYNPDGEVLLVSDDDDEQPDAEIEDACEAAAEYQEESDDEPAEQTNGTLLQLWGNWPSTSPVFRYTISVRGERVVPDSWQIERAVPAGPITRELFEKRLRAINYCTDDEMKTWLLPWDTGKRTERVFKKTAVDQRAVDMLARVPFGRDTVHNMLLSPRMLLAATMYNRQAFAEAQDQIRTRIEYFVDKRPDSLAFASERIDDVYNRLEIDLVAEQVMRLVMCPPEWGTPPSTEYGDLRPTEMPKDPAVYERAVALYRKCKMQRAMSNVTQVPLLTENRPEQATDADAINYLSDSVTVVHTTLTAPLKHLGGLRLIEGTLHTSWGLECKLFDFLRTVHSYGRVELKHVPERMFDTYADVFRCLERTSLLCVATDGPCPQSLVRGLHKVMPDQTLYISCRSLMNKAVPGALTLDYVVSTRDIGRGKVSGVVLLGAEALSSVDLRRIFYVFPTLRFMVLIGHEHSAVPKPSEDNWGTPFHAMCTTNAVMLKRIKSTDTDDRVATCMRELSKGVQMPFTYHCQMETIDIENTAALRTVADTLLESNGTAIAVYTNNTDRIKMQRYVDSLRGHDKKNTFVQGSPVLVHPGRVFGRLAHIEISDEIPMISSSGMEWTQPLGLHRNQCAHIQVLLSSTTASQCTQVKVNPTDSFPMSHSECVQLSDVNFHEQRYQRVYLFVDAKFCDPRVISAAAAVATDDGQFVVVGTPTGVSQALQRRPRMHHSHLRQLLGEGFTAAQ